MGGDPVPQLPAPWSYFRLTAFVLKSFAQARSFVFIDPRELAAAKGWIVRRQQVDGSFPATGRILNKDIQVSCPACSWCRRAGRRGLSPRARSEAENPRAGRDPRLSSADGLCGGCASGDGCGLGGEHRGLRGQAGGMSERFPLQACLGPLLCFPGTCPRRYKLHLGTTPSQQLHTLSWSKDGKLGESLPPVAFMTLKQSSQLNSMAPPGAHGNTWLIC